MSNIILYHNLGLGDHFICHGLVREYCKKYEKITTFSLPQNYSSVSFMYRDLPNLQIIKGERDFIKNFIPSNKDKYDSVKIVGSQYLDENSGLSFEEQFYQMAEIDLAKKWESFFVKRDLKREEGFYKKHAPNEKYIFLHEDTKRNYEIERNKIKTKYKIFIPSEKLTENIFDYCAIIEKADEIHVIDSSFMFLIDCLEYENPSQKLFVHRYARENVKWKLPILKKKWDILILDNNWGKNNKSVSKLLNKIEELFLSHPLLKRATRKIYRTLNWRTRSQNRGSV